MVRCTPPQSVLRCDAIPIRWSCRQRSASGSPPMSSATRLVCRIPMMPATSCSARPRSSRLQLGTRLLFVSCMQFHRVRSASSCRQSPRCSARAPRAVGEARSPRLPRRSRRLIDCRMVLAGALIAAATTSASAQHFTAADAAIKNGIAAGIYPGAVLVAGRADTILYARGYGHFTWSTASPTPDPSTTRWDLASLTKILATTSAIAVLVQQHRVDLDAPVAHYLPEFSSGRKSEVTVRMLLNHTSGMPPYAKLWESAHTVAQARATLFLIPLRRAPGSSAEYSDLNAML